MGFLSIQQEQKISAIHTEVTGRDAPVEASSMDTRTGDDPMGMKVQPWGHVGCGEGGAMLHSGVLLGLVKPLDVVDGKSPKAFVVFLM